MTESVPDKGYRRASSIVGVTDRRGIATRGHGGHVWTTARVRTAVSGQTPAAFLFTGVRARSETHVGGTVYPEESGRSERTFSIMPSSCERLSSPVRLVTIWPLGETSTVLGMPRRR